MTAVVDAGAAVDVVLERPGSEQLAAALAEHTGELHAPQLFLCEASSAIRKRVRRGEATEHRAGLAIDDILAMPIAHHRHSPLIEPAWQLRHNFSSYDAVYVALAGLLGPNVELITTDERLATAVRTHTTIQVTTP